MAFNFSSFKESIKDSIPFPRDKKQQILIVVLLAAVFVAAGVLYFGFWRSPTSSDSGLDDQYLPSDRTRVSAEFQVDRVLNKIDFDISFLKTPRFQELKAYGQWPLEIGEKGQSNPFLSN